MTYQLPFFTLESSKLYLSRNFTNHNCKIMKLPSVIVGTFRTSFVNLVFFSFRD